MRRLRRTPGCPSARSGSSCGAAGGPTASRNRSATPSTTSTGAFAAVGRLLQRHNGPIFPLIEDLFGVSVVEVHQEIAAVVASAKLAAELKVDAGSAALEMRRTYTTSDGEIAQVTINTHPSSRFRYSMTMRRVKA